MPGARGPSTLNEDQIAERGARLEIDVCPEELEAGGLGRLLHQPQFY